MLNVKYLSLQKTELEYEVRIRGATPAASVEELRKQIVKLSAAYPSEHVLESPLDTAQDLKGCAEVLNKIQTNLDSTDLTSATLARTQNMLNHLFNRLERITSSGENKKQHDELNQKYKILTQRCLSKITPSTSFSAEEGQRAPEVQNLISVSCDRTSAELGKLKFNGRTCVRAFIQKVEEFMESRSITSTKILRHASEIFQDDALHWYRAVKDKVDSWDELSSLLKDDFSQADYDYKLISEIRSRTQGERENITIYLSIMSGMFARLSKPLSESDQLEILLHNIRPCYASTLASASQIQTLDILRTLCRNYETIQVRLSQFQEPPKVTASTLAPEFAYTKENKPVYNAGTNQPRYFNRNTNTNYSQNNFKNSNTAQNYNVHTIQSNERQPYCPRCRNNTHSLRVCQAPRDIVCFKCGRKGVKRPDCPSCNLAPKN